MDTLSQRRSSLRCGSSWPAMSAAWGYCGGVDHADAVRGLVGTLT
jgi:hypothetical protein